MVVRLQKCVYTMLNNTGRIPAPLSEIKGLDPTGTPAGVAGRVLPDQGPHAKFTMAIISDSSQKKVPQHC